jgi:hypothetical protein
VKNVRRKYISLLVILILLAANIGFVPNAYADSTSSASNPSGSSGSVTVQPGTGASAQNENVAGNVYTSNASATAPFDIQKTLTENVHSNNSDYTDQVIDYPAIPSMSYSISKKVYQTGSAYMRHVIHMPKLRIRTGAKGKNGSQGVASSVSGSVYANSGASATVAGQSPATNQSSGVSSVASSVYGSVYTASSNPSAITSLGENDLNLYDFGQSWSGVAGSVYAQASVASSVYSSVYSSFPIRNKSGLFTAGFSRQAGGSLLQFSYLNAGVTLAPLSAASVAGSVYQNSITYRDVYPDTDLEYAVEPDRLKEALTIKRYTGQSDFLFQLSVSDAVYKVVYGGAISFCDPLSGEPLFFMPVPFATDKNGKRCDLGIELGTDGLLTVSIDQSWLKSAAYPVVIDPSINLVTGCGVESWWNYTSMNLGGGWKVSVNTGI